MLEPSWLDYIKGDQISWEKEPMKKLTKKKELGVFEHAKFWQSMDTIREKNILETLWKNDSAPWKVW